MKRTVDGRIIGKRVIIAKKLLKKILLDIKISNHFSWKKFANLLGVSEQTLRHEWLKDKSTVPYELFRKVLSMDRKINQKKIMNKIKFIEPFWGQKLAGGENKSKKINFPNKSRADFAEFYGIMLGDGCLFSDLKGLSITADRILEKDYFSKHVSHLIERLFGLTPKFYLTKGTRTIRCVLYSKNVVEYLAKLGFPIGTKKDLHIPLFIKKNKKCLLKCLRGIMDTDGSLSSHPHSKIMIHLSITSKTLREDVAVALKEIQIKPGVFSKGIMLYGQNAIKFCNKIGFSNLKNKVKYNFFLKEDVVPRSQYTEMLMGEGVIEFSK